MRLPLALLLVHVVLLLSGTARGDTAATAHIDAIQREAKLGREQAGQLKRELAQAYDDAAKRDARHAAEAKRLDNARFAAENELTEIKDGWAYFIGKWIVALFFTWAIALLVTFVLRCLFATIWRGRVFGTVGAMVTTWILHVLTFGLTLTTNVPDNLFFNRRISDLEAENNRLRLAVDPENSGGVK